MSITRRPVLWVMSALAGLNATLALGTLQQLVSPTVYGWVLLCSAGLQASVQFWVQGQVTPLTRPRDHDGTELARVG